MRTPHIFLFCSLALFAITAASPINQPCAFAQAAAPMTAKSGTAAMATPKPTAPLSTTLTLTVKDKATKFSVAELAAMPQKTVKVHNAHTNADESYTGVLLSDLLAKAGFVADKTTQQTLLRSIVRAEGTDKYWVVYSATEVEGSEHAGDVIVAISQDGHSLGADGNLKLISSDDKKPQRWVRNLSSISLNTVQ
jgi:hypothetical protein